MLKTKYTTALKINGIYGKISRDYKSIKTRLTLIARSSPNNRIPDKKEKNKLPHKVKITVAVRKYSDQCPRHEGSKNG